MTSLESEPLLRTLSPALRQLEQNLRGWLGGPHRYPIPTMRQATLTGLANDLGRSSEALDVDRPLLVVMLMGGTGVGKSTLLNALAGGAIAASGVARPTTRDPVVYYHDSMKPERLDPALRTCRLVPHDRMALQQKVIVDTPDLDSNDLANRETLLRVLPVADVVLYVGSQEKYHDQLGWQLFLQQRRRRAFAFVLNKWDRCLHSGAVGLRPDEDLLLDLKREGFQDPLLFRTCAQLWVDRAGGNDAPEPPPGEQFQELSNWLEQGLNRLEIEAIKARGVSQLLQHLDGTLVAASPPDLREAAQKTQAAWEKALDEEGSAEAEVLLDTLEPYQREIEHHFSLEGQRRFHGLMAGYLHLFTRARYAGSTLRDRMPFMGRGADAEVQAPSTWNLSTFTRACSDAASTRHLDARGKALANRLLLTADEIGLPLELLNEQVEAVVHNDWRRCYAQALIEVVNQVEQQWTRPHGSRRLLQRVLVTLANWLPIVALLGSCFFVLWQYFNPDDPATRPQLLELLLVPVITLLLVLVVLHVLIAVLLPMRWSRIRGEFDKLLEDRLQLELKSAYLSVPTGVARDLLEERRQIERLIGETRDVAEWLEQREQAASIAGLYGSGDAPPPEKSEGRK